MGSLFLVGCGNDEKKSDDESNKPLTTKNSCGYSGVIDGADTTLKFTSDGDIRIVCQEENEQYFSEYKLINDVNSLTIVDVIKVINFEATSNLGNSGSEIQTLHYKEGTIHYTKESKIDGKTEKYDCIETYPSPLPQTIFNETTILELLEWKAVEDDRVKTTCPKEFYEESEQEEDEILEVRVLFNYTLIDSDGKKHLLTRDQILSNVFLETDNQNDQENVNN